MYSQEEWLIIWGLGESIGLGSGLKDLKGE